MCRRNLLWGCSLIAFGVGIGLGARWGEGMLIYGFAIAVVAFGFGMLPKKG